MSAERFDLRGKVALVTGAAGLLGREHVRALAEHGASVVLVDLDRERVAAQAAALGEEHAVETLGLACDVSRPEDVDALRDAVLARFDRLDVLVNNAALDEKVEAGQAEESRFEQYPLEQWQRMLAVNLTGPFLCCQRLGSVMAARGAGSIVNVASTYGLVAPQQALYRRPDGSQSFWKSAAYPTTKGGLIQLTRFLAAYWGERGVRVNALCPGGVDNGAPAHFRDAYAARTPLGRMALAGDYQGALVFLASDAASYVTGATIVVDGGWTAW